jgi:methionine-R-sulfoxide reductase
MKWLWSIPAGIIGLAAVGFGFQSYTPPEKDPHSPKRADKLVLTDAQWRKRLTPKQYAILRGHGTEAAFCGVFYDNHKTGTYYCAGCGEPLFKSGAKFDSGTGWPSFFQPVSKKAIWTRTDDSYGMHRVEVLCARCDGHLGHEFDDAPQTPTGQRFCINSDALVFKEKK